MTPGAEVIVLGSGQISHVVKMPYFFKYISTPMLGIHQTEFIVMMTKEGSTKIVNFITRSRGCCARAWPNLVI